MVSEQVAFLGIFPPDVGPWLLPFSHDSISDYQETGLLGVIRSGSKWVFQFIPKVLYVVEA